MSWCRHRVRAQVPSERSRELALLAGLSQGSGWRSAGRPPSALGLPKTHLLRNLSREREHRPFQGGVRPVFKAHVSSSPFLTPRPGPCHQPVFDVF